MMPEAMSPLPTRADDPRLEGWYHTIELAPGLVTRDATYDLRTVVDRVGLPESLKGLSALDVGTADGFWAFELERRGADPVVAVDIPRLGATDVIPRRRAGLPEAWSDAPVYCQTRFATAHAMRQSRVEYKTCTIYELSPSTVGTFDVVYCGSLLVHLFNPLQALIQLRSVTRRMAIIETVSFHPEHEAFERTFPNAPLMWFGSLDAEGDEPGKHCMYWRFSQRALHDMLIYAGFDTIEPLGHFSITGPGGGNVPVTAVVARVDEGGEGGNSPMKISIGFEQ